MLPFTIYLRCDVDTCDTAWLISAHDDKAKITPNVSMSEREPNLAANFPGLGGRKERINESVCVAEKVLFARLGLEKVWYRLLQRRGVYDTRGLSRRGGKQSCNWTF